MATAAVPDDDDDNVLNVNMATAVLNHSLNQVHAQNVDLTLTLEYSIVSFRDKTMEILSWAGTSMWPGHTTQVWKLEQQNL